MGWIQEWFAQNATVGTLLLLMGCDVTTGIMLAIVNKKLNSSASTKGMIRKSIALMFVGIGQALEKFFGNTPVYETIAIGFCLSELMSIAENAGLLGVPLPPPLKRIMSVLAEQAKTIVVALTWLNQRSTRLSTRMATHELFPHTQS